MSQSPDDWLAYTPDLPIAISCVGNHYLLFDVKAVSWLRRDHRLCGYNIGTLPQSPSQNVFLGLPIIIMPEEAQILIEKGVAYILDDARAHDQAIYDRKSSHQEEYLAKARRQAGEVEEMRGQERAEARDRALSKQKAKFKSKAKTKDADKEASLLTFDDLPASPLPSQPSNESQDTPFKLLTNPPPSQSYHITPATSRLLLPANPLTLASKTIPQLASSYPLFRHLHNRGYFMTPGLRFGCQYSTYPGDPLRFHSHFLAVGYDWEQDIDLMDIVGGGRLGTGVKKGFLLGGVQPKESDGSEEKVRTFSVEWAVM